MSWMAIYEDRPKQRIFFRPMSMQNAFRYQTYPCKVADDKKTAEALLREKLSEIAAYHERRAEIYRSASHLVADTEDEQ